MLIWEDYSWLYPCPWVLEPQMNHAVWFRLQGGLRWLRVAVTLRNWSLWPQKGYRLVQFKLLTQRTWKMRSNVTVFRILSPCCFLFSESVHNSRNISKHIMHIQTTCNECVACAASQERTVLLLRPVNHAEDLDSEDRPEFRFTLQKFLGWKRGVTLFSPVALCSSVWNCLKDGIELNGDEI